MTTPYKHPDPVINDLLRWIAELTDRVRELEKITAHLRAQ